MSTFLYNPEGFLYNPEARQKVHDWLEVAATLLAWGPACILWLVGPSGIGKASLVKAWAAEHDWELSLLSADNLHNAKEVIDQMAKIVNTQSFASAFANHGARPTRAMLIDDLDVFASVDRGFFGAFADCFKYAHWRPAPCICIVPPHLEKRVRDLRKGMVIAMPAPAAAEIRTWSGGAAGTVGGKGATGAAYAAHLIECNGNMSYLKFLQENGTPGQVCQVMDRNLGAEALFELPRLPKHVLRRVVLEDPWFHPLRFHENCISEMAKRKGAVKTKLTNYSKIISVFLTWDVLIGPSGGSAASHNHAMGTTVATDIATELVVIAAREYMGGAMVKAAAAGAGSSGGSTLSFTKMLSHLSLQKKHRREQYETTPFGFPCPSFL